MKRRYLLLITAGAASVIFGALARAAEIAVEFAEKAAWSSMFEIEFSELALRKARSSDLAAFANRIIADHTEAGHELESLVAGKFRLPTRLKSEDEELWQKLENTEEGFDQLYVEMQIKAHEDLVALFTAFVQAGEDGPLKQFAVKTLPVLEQHLDMIRTIEQKLGVT